MHASSRTQLDRRLHFESPPARVGALLEAKGGDGMWWPVEVLGINEDGTYIIYWRDGIEWSGNFLKRFDQLKVMDSVELVKSNLNPPLSSNNKFSVTTRHPRTSCVQSPPRRSK